MILKLAVGSSLFLLISCKSSSQESNEGSFDDASQFSVNDDGKYDVICKNGDEEVHDRATLKRGIMNPNDQTICKNDGDDPNKERVRCVAKDKDDRDPYYLAIVAPLKDPKPWEPTIHYWKKDECVLISDAIYGGESGVCLSKIRDNKNPFLMHLITDKRLFVPATGGTFAASEDCRTFYKDLEQIEGKSLGCWSKDFDGKRPYAVFEVDENYNIKRADARTFPSLETCVDSLDDE